MGSTSFSSIKAICFLVFVLVGSVSCVNNTVCPLNYLFHAGDGFFDVGNAVLIPGIGPKLPANRRPYGMTTPGHPTGRWNDGLLDMDIGGVVMGFPIQTPSLRANASSDNSIIFAVAGSTVLDHSFFAARKIRVPSIGAPLSLQMKWFRQFINSICSTPAECSSKVADSVFMFGDVEANDIGIPLSQGRSIREVREYASLVTDAQISAAREVLRMGGRRLVFPGSAPIGCFPYLLTKLASNNSADYDSLGCLRRPNAVIRHKNDLLQRAVSALAREYPDFIIVFADIYGTFETVLRDSLAGPNRDVSLKACCGAGGKYNYDSKRFCSSRGARACADPSRYLHWDGIHLTQNAHNRLSSILQVGVVPTFNCRAS